MRKIVLIRKVWETFQVSACKMSLDSQLIVLTLGREMCWWQVQHARGRWNSLDSLFVFGWSGSAFLGGYLIAAGGFSASFLITAFLQLVAWAVLLPLIYILPSKPPDVAAILNNVSSQPLLMFLSIMDESVWSSSVV